mgnify:CR=1 FL=1
MFFNKIEWLISFFIAKSVINLYHSTYFVGNDTKTTMKSKLFIIALLAIVAVGCERVIDLPEPNVQGGDVVTIEATIPPETRVAYTDSYTSGNGGTLAWQTGDQLRLAAYNGNTYIGSSLFTFVTGSANKFTGTLVEGATPHHRL